MSVGSAKANLTENALNGINENGKKCIKNDYFHGHRDDSGLADRIYRGPQLLTTSAQGTATSSKLSDDLLQLLVKAQI